MPDETIIDVAQPNNDATKSLLNQEDESGATDENNEVTQKEQSEENAEEEKTEVPEDYGEFELTEGIEINDEFMNKAKDLFAESKLTKEQAQKFVTLENALVKDLQKKQMDAFVKITDDWATETKKEYGEKLKEELAFAKKARDQFFDEDFKKFVDESGLGNHPALIRGLNKIGKLMSEDRVPTGKSGGGEPVFDPRQIYNKSNMNP